MSNLISWDDQRTFLAVLEEGSLSAAARRLGVSQPTVRGRIAALENALGTVLFTRSVNGLTPTSSALALREPARTMAMASDLFVRHASASLGEVAGTVRISVPEFMGIEVGPQMLRDLHDMHPDLHVEMSLSNAPADVLGQEVDIAIRMMEPAQNALIAKKVATIPLGFFASHEYVNRRGAPKTMADLASHELIGPDRSRADLEFTNRLAPDFPLERFVLRTDSHPAQYAAARAGLGIAVVQVSVGDATPGLVHLLPDLTVAELPTWVVTHENLRHIPRVAAVFGFLVNALSSPKQSSDLRNGYGIDEALPKAVKHYLTRISAILTRVACEPDPDALLRIRLAPDLHDTGWQFAVAIRFAARTLCPAAGLPVPDMPDEHNCATLLKFAKDVSSIIDPISGRDLTETVTHIAGEVDLTQKPAEYAAGFAFPNMLFHLSVAYAGLRHGGMKIGKADFDGLHIYTNPS